MSAIDYKRHIVPLLDRFDSESMHKAAVTALHYAGRIPGGCRLLARLFHPSTEFTKLQTNLAGLVLDSPVMVGAGWDKEGRAVLGLRSLGFAAVEIGGVVEYTQAGRPKPRQFVIGPGVALNRMGLNSPGVEVVKNNLQVCRGHPVIVGANVARNENVPDEQTAQAYARVVDALFAVCAFFTLNVSCPNTAHFMQLQEKEMLALLITTVRAVMVRHGQSKPVFIKVSPDLTRAALSDIIRVALDLQVDGVVATNTTVRADLKSQYGARWGNEAGGLSGDNEAFRQMTLRSIAQIYQESAGLLPIIGVGGVKDGKSALQKIQAGATAVQVVTALRGEGPGVAYRIKSELQQWMDANGVQSLAEVRGVSDVQTFC